VPSSSDSLTAGSNDRTLSLAGRRLATLALFVYPLLVFPANTFGPGSGMFFYPRLTFLLFLVGGFLLLPWLLRESGARLRSPRLDLWSLPGEVAVGGAYVAWILFTSLFLSSSRSLALFGPTGWYASGVFLIFTWLLVWAVAYRAAPLRLSILLWFGIVPGILALLGVLEAVGLRPLFGSAWFNVNQAFRMNPFPLPITTFGNSTYMGVFFVLVLAIPLHALVRERLGPRAKAGAAAFLLAALIGIAVTYSRGAYLGGAVVVLGMLIATGAKPLRRWAVVAGLVLAAVLVSYAIPRVGEALNPSAATAGDVGKSTEPLNSGSFTTRTLMWSAAFRMFRERPFSGWGMETFQNHFLDHLTYPELKRWANLEYGVPNDRLITVDGFTLGVWAGSSGNETFEREIAQPTTHPHGVLFDQLYAFGLPGFLLYLTLQVMIARRVLLSRDPLAVSLLIGYAGYLAGLLFLFDTVAVTPTASVIAGAAVARALASPATARREAGAATVGVTA
jgi:O-antigen ligase